MPRDFRGDGCRAFPRDSRTAWCLSSIGIGTYLGEPDEATDEGVHGGDCCRGRRRHQCDRHGDQLPLATQRTFRRRGAARTVRKGYSRDEIMLCTKAGFLTPDGAMPADPNVYFSREFLEKGVFRTEDIAAGCHCMTPRTWPISWIAAGETWALRSSTFSTCTIPKRTRAKFRGGIRQSHPRSVFVSGIGGDGAADSFLWHGYVECVSRRSEGSRIFVAGRNGEHRKGCGGRRSSFPVRATAV